jgi:hypothetical protein
MRTVLDVIHEITAGEEIECIVLHRHPHRQDKYLPPGTSKNDPFLDDVARDVPCSLLDRAINTADLTPYFSYDEEARSTVSFTIWTSSSVYEHRWTSDCTPHCGGNVVRLRCSPRHPTTNNPLLRNIR